VKGNRSAVFVVGVNGRNLKRLTPWSLDAGEPKWSPDGTKILFNDNDDYQGNSKSLNLFTIGPTGKRLMQLTHWTAGTFDAFQGSWSPDGTKVVYTKTGTQLHGIFVMDSRGGHERQLTHLAINSNTAVWGTGG
jgi:Tol biopolymer transport system component